MKPEDFANVKLDPDKEAMHAAKRSALALAGIVHLSRMLAEKFPKGTKLPAAELDALDAICKLARIECVLEAYATFIESYDNKGGMSTETYQALYGLTLCKAQNKLREHTQKAFAAIGIKAPTTPDASAQMR